MIVKLQYLDKIINIISRKPFKNMIGEIIKRELLLVARSKPSEFRKRYISVRNYLLSTKAVGKKTKVEKCVCG